MESISSYIILVFTAASDFMTLRSVVQTTLPGFAAIDYDRLVAAWYEEGHVSARSIARGAEDSVVMQRLALQDRKRSHTPIGTTRTSWV